MKLRIFFCAGLCLVFSANAAKLQATPVTVLSATSDECTGKTKNDDEALSLLAHGVMNNKVTLAETANAMGNQAIDGKHEQVANHDEDGHRPVDDNDPMSMTDDDGPSLLAAGGDIETRPKIKARLDVQKKETNKAQERHQNPKRSENAVHQDPQTMMEKDFGEEPGDATPETTAMKMVKSPEYGTALTTMAAILGASLKTGKFDSTHMMQLGGSFVNAAAAFIGISFPIMGLVMSVAWGFFEAIYQSEKKDVATQIYDKVMEQVKVHVSNELMKERLWDLSNKITEMKRQIHDIAKAKNTSKSNRIHLWRNLLEKVRDISLRIRKSEHKTSGVWCNTMVVILPMIELVEITSYIQYWWMVDDAQQDEVPHAGESLARITKELLPRMETEKFSYTNVWNEIVPRAKTWLFQDIDRTLGFKEWHKKWRFAGDGERAGREQLVVATTMKKFSYHVQNISCVLSPSICDRSESFPDERSWRPLRGSFDTGAIPPWASCLLSVKQCPWQRSTWEWNRKKDREIKFASCRNEMEKIQSLHKSLNLCTRTKVSEFMQLLSEPLMKNKKQHEELLESVRMAAGSDGADHIEWVQQMNTQCGSTAVENAAAEAAIGRQNMNTPGRHDNSHLKNWVGQSKSLAQCQADCLANIMCRGVEIQSNSADLNHKSGCSLMYSGTSGGHWTSACWYIKKNGKVWKYEALNPALNPYLIKHGAECTSGDQFMGFLSSAHVCALVVQANGGTFFVYGTGEKQGHCYQESTKSAQCSEGWETDSYDFYSVDVVDPGGNAQLIKKGVECRSGDKHMGKQPSLHACAAVVAANGGTFLLYGVGRKQGHCYREYTKSAQCPEGWQRDDYNFYSVPVPIS